MHCVLCGRANVTFGDGHLCVADGAVTASPGSTPGPAWRVMSWVLLGLTVPYLLACAVKIVLLVQDYRLVERLTARPGGADLAELERLASSERAVGTLLAFLVLAYLVGLVVWLAMTWRVAIRNAIDPRTILRHWTVAAWTVSIFVSVVLAYLTREPTVNTDDLEVARADLLAFDRGQIIFTSVRMLVATLLIASVWGLRKRVRNAVFGPLESTLQRVS